MKKKSFDVNAFLELFKGKEAYLAIFATLIYQTFVAVRIPYKYLAHISVIVVPALMGAVVKNDKELTKALFVSGMAIGSVPFMRDLFAHLSTKTSGKTQQFFQKAAYELGAPVNTVSGVVTGSNVRNYANNFIEAGQNVLKTIPANNGVINRQALATHTSKN